jgi:hypothetical protein
MITAVDTHACGEPGRVITGGVLDVPGKSMFEKKVWLETNANHLRRRMLREPRGYPAANCNLILPPTIAEADAGFVIMEQTHRRQNKAVAKMTSAAPDPVSGSPFGCNFPQPRFRPTRAPDMATFRQGGPSSGPTVSSCRHDNAVVDHVQKDGGRQLARFLEHKAV